jgi:hypothetical protein
VILNTTPICTLPTSLLSSLIKPIYSIFCEGLSEQDSQNMEYIGFINDDNNEVGKVHIGVVFKMD